MKHLVTRGIVLARTDYGEADRIVTMLTPEQGKLRLMARGVRKPQSKLAGGIELFSISDLTYITGKGEIGTLISSRLKQHYGNIVKDLARVQLGYELIKTLNKATEDHPEAAYFELLNQAFAALDNSATDLELINAWFQAQLLYLAGHSPNLTIDTANQKLDPDQAYTFDFEAMSFAPHPQGSFTASHIKALRLLFSGHSPANLQNVQGIITMLKDLSPLIRTMGQTR